MVDPLGRILDGAGERGLREFAERILSMHEPGHTMGSGIQLCSCGAVLSQCSYRALLARVLCGPTIAPHPDSGTCRVRDTAYQSGPTR